MISTKLWNGGEEGQEADVRSERVMYLPDMLERVQSKALVFRRFVAGASNEMRQLWTKIDIFNIADDVHKSYCAA